MIVYIHANFKVFDERVFPDDNDSDSLTIQQDKNRVLIKIFIHRPLAYWICITRFLVDLEKF